MLGQAEFGPAEAATKRPSRGPPTPRRWGFPFPPLTAARAPPAGAPPSRAARARTLLHRGWQPPGARVQPRRLARARPDWSPPRARNGRTPSSPLSPHLLFSINEETSAVMAISGANIGRFFLPQVPLFSTSLYKSRGRTLGALPKPLALTPFSPSASRPQRRRCGGTARIIPT